MAINESFINERIESEIAKQDMSAEFSIDKKNSIGQVVNGSIVKQALEQALKDRVNHFLLEHDDLSEDKKKRIIAYVIHEAFVHLKKYLHNYTIYTASEAIKNIDQLSISSRDSLLEKQRQLVDSQFRHVEEVLEAQQHARNLANRTTLHPHPEKKEDSKSEKVAEHAEHLIKIEDNAAVATLGFAARLEALHKAVETSTLQHANIGLIVGKGLDFVLTPALYLACYIEGKEVPFTSHNNFRWAVSAVGLALAITAVVVPPVAGIIFVALAAIGVGMSAYTLGRYIYTRNKLSNEISQLKQEQHKTTAEVVHCKDELDNVQEQLDSYLKLSPNEQATNKPKIHKLKQRVGQLHYQHDKAVRQLVGIKVTLKEKLAQHHSVELHTKKLVKRSIGMVLAGVLLVGAVTALFFPPVGLAIVAGAAVVGAAVALQKPVSKLFKAIGSWFSRSNQKTVESAPKNTEQEGLTPKPEAVDSVTHQQHDVEHLESTAQVMQQLYGVDSQRQSRQLVLTIDKQRKLDRHLHHLVVENNCYGVLKFFVEVGRLNSLDYYITKLRYLRPAAKVLTKAVNQIMEGKLVINNQDLEVFTGDYARALQENLGVKNLNRIAELLEPSDDIHRVADSMDSNQQAGSSPTEPRE